MRYELDSNARRASQGTALFGGSPFRLVRLSPAGARFVDAWLDGRPIETPPSALALRRRLLTAGLIHPWVEPQLEDNDHRRIGFVLPVFDDAGGLADVLTMLQNDFSGSPVVVVDDGSSSPIDAGALGPAGNAADVSLVRHEVNRGPAAARNTGAKALADSVEIVAFIDSDVVVDAEAIWLVLAHFADASVVAVAPRIRALPGHSKLDRYETLESPLDLGASPAIVRPGSPVPYVPSTLLAVRRGALHEVQGFDEELRVGEDVDCVWRLIGNGGVVRYEPRAVAYHRNRPSWRALVCQRHNYGTAAAQLDRRHPGDVAPIELPAQTLVAWVAACFGGPFGMAAGLGLGVRDAAKLRQRLADRVDQPERETLRLSAMSHAHAGRWLTQAVTRAWLPLITVGALVSSRARRVLVVSMVLPSALRWWRQRPGLDPVSYVAARALDDAAYGSGLWRGMVTRRSLRALLPRVAARQSQSD